MKKISGRITAVIASVFIVFFGCIPSYGIIHADGKINYSETVAETDTLNTEENLTLHARAAALMDASNMRLLYGKDENTVYPMASTTKIMTLIIALEYGNPDEIVTFSPYAAIQPDVQMNAVNGEQYRLKDLLYALMLRSYNDVAVAVAEHIGEKYLKNEDVLQTDSKEIKSRTKEESREYVKVFADLMNEKAKSYGCENTYFITPNGLDAKDENNIHSTTAYEMAVIASHAVQNEEVLKICGTDSYSFSEINNKRTVSVTNADKFLLMMDGALGLKTGFTGEAGYCFVGAVKKDNRILVSVVLGSGWPPNKNYKWEDTKKLMNYGFKNYFEQIVFRRDDYFKNISVIDGTQEYVTTEICYNLKMLIKEGEKVTIEYIIPDEICAPVNENTQIGTAVISIDGKEYRGIPVLAGETVLKKNFFMFLRKIFGYFLY